MIALLLLACTGGTDKATVRDSGGGTDTVECDWVGEYPTFCNKRPKNVVIVSIDTTRRDHISRFDPDRRDLTPFIDSLMDQGFVLENHNTGASWTKPGMALAMGGIQLYDWGKILKIKDQPDGPPRETLAKVLTDAGYTTILRTTNGWVHSTGIDYGFQDASHPDGDTVTSIFNEARSAWQSKGGLASAPWLVQIHVKEPHAPYNPPDSYLEGIDELAPLDIPVETWEMHYDAIDLWPDMTEEEQAALEAHLRFRYEAEIRWMDDQLRDGFQMLSDIGMLDDALVVMYTDHGEAFWEHGYQNHAWYMHPAESHGFGLFWAKDMQPGAFTDLTGNIDFPPTIARALGVEGSPDWTGFAVGDGGADRVLIGESYGRRGLAITARTSDLRVAWRAREDETLAWDLVADPEEQTDIWNPSDPAQAALWDALLPAKQAYETLAAEAETGGSTVIE